MFITPLYAAICGLIFIFLSIRVIKTRRQQNVALGTGQDTKLTKVIRVHANFAEYVPIGLLLLFFFETQWKAAIVVHLFGVSFIIARLVHAYGVSQKQENLRYRVFGMVVTFSVICVLSVGILLSYL